MWISPSLRNSDFEMPLSIDDKITIFEDRTLGWKLNIADKIINGEVSSDEAIELEPIPHSGFATLDIVLSYFEMIGKYIAGFNAQGRSEDHFKDGVISVFPALGDQDRAPANPGINGIVKTPVDEALDILYKGVRCGLYHAGVTPGKVVLAGEIPHPFAFDPIDRILVINPHHLVPTLKEHLSNYVAQLREEANRELRKIFERRFDFHSHV